MFQGLKEFFGLGGEEKPKEKEKEEVKLSISTQAEQVREEVTKKIAVDTNSINVVDVFHNAIGSKTNKIEPKISTIESKTNKIEPKTNTIESKTNNFYVTTILGTGQERFAKEQGVNKNIFSGPLEESTHVSTRSSEIQTSELQILVANREAYMSPAEFTRQSKKPLADFAKWVLTKAESESDSKHGNEPIKWLLSAHSRGAVIARLLANNKTHTHTFTDGRKVTITSEKDAAFRTITISNANGEIIKKYPLETHLLLFSATPGLGAKANDDFIHLGAGVKLIDFIAAQDGVVKGTTFKPLTHRRTITQDGSSLFVHLPVYHAAVTKGLQKKTLHLEVEILISYLFSQYAGIDINVDALKLPLRTKSSDSKTTSFLDINLLNGQSFSSDNCDIGDCIAAIKHKFAAMKSSPEYKNPQLMTDLHEERDQRFLVMRAGVYATVLEERLALAEQASAGGHPALHHLFEADKSPEAQAYIKFAQLIVNKNGLNDPGLKEIKNRQDFSLLKTAAILHDEKFTVSLFQKIESTFGGAPDNYEAAYRVIALKNSILSFLECQPVSTTDKNLKELLITFLPQILERNNLKSEALSGFLAILPSPEFLLLKTAEILNDKDFTVSLFQIIDSSFGGDQADYQVIALKNSILSFLESQPGTTDKNLKELLITFLPKILERNNLKSEAFSGFLASLQSPVVKLDRFIKGTCELKNISRESVAKELEKILTGFSDIRRDSFRQKAMNTIFPPEEKSINKNSPKETAPENEGFVISTARKNYTLFEHKPSPEKDSPIISDLVCLN